MPDHLKETLWVFIGSSPVWAGLAAFAFMIGGRLLTREIGLLGTAGAVYLGWVAWTTAASGLSLSMGALTPQNQKDVAVVACCVGFIVGAGLSLFAKLRDTVTGANLTIDDLGRNVTVVDRMTATRVFNAAKNTYERFCDAHPIRDHLTLTDGDAAPARTEPALLAVERRLRQVETWCRTERAPGLTASILDQLGALYLRQGRLADARTCLEEADTIFASIPNADRQMTRTKSSCHYRFGVVDFREGNTAKALESFERSLREAQSVGLLPDDAHAKAAIDRCRDLLRS